jgi:hypothetical protein
MLPILMLMDWAAGGITSASVNIETTTTLLQSDVSGYVITVATADDFITTSGSGVVNISTDTTLIESN